MSTNYGGSSAVSTLECIISFYHHHSLRQVCYYYLPVPDGEAGAQRSQVTRPRPHSKEVAELGYTLKVAGTKDYAFYNVLTSISLYIYCVIQPSQQLYEAGNSITLKRSSKAISMNLHRNRVEFIPGLLSLVLFASHMPL